MSLPPMQIYQFEDQLEQAVSAWLLKNGVNDVSKQRDMPVKLEDGTVQNLKTPRVVPKVLFGGFGQNEHYYINSVGRWLDIGVGTLYLKIVTRRDTSEPTHAYLRGLCRYLMQQASQITGLLKYHQIEKIIEQQSTASLGADKLHDLSSLSFQTWLRIRPEFFPLT
jgi:hypothetical protein